MIKWGEKLCIYKISFNRIKPPNKTKTTTFDKDSNKVLETERIIDVDDDNIKIEHIASFSKDFKKPIQNYTVDNQDYTNDS